MQGWSKQKQTYRYKDGSTWRCNDKCTDAHDPIYEVHGLASALACAPAAAWLRARRVAPLPLPTLPAPAGWPLLMWCSPCPALPTSRVSVSAPPTHLQAVIYNPLNGKWSKKGSLGEMMQMRLYHSTAVLLPSCKVMPPTDCCALCTAACCHLATVSHISGTHQGLRALHRVSASVVAPSNSNPL